MTSLRYLLAKEKDEDSPKLNILLTESLLAVYVSLLINALATYDCFMLYRLVAHKFDTKLWSSLFGGGIKTVVTMGKTPKPNRMYIRTIYRWNKNTEMVKNCQTAGPKKIFCSLLIVNFLIFLLDLLIFYHWLSPWHVNHTSPISQTSEYSWKRVDIWKSNAIFLCFFPYYVRNMDFIFMDFSSYFTWFAGLYPKYNLYILLLTFLINLSERCIILLLLFLDRKH